MGKIDEKYLYYSTMPTGDITEHMATLLNYAKESDTIAELGTRYLISAWAFLCSRPKKMICVDIKHPSFYGDDGTKNLNIAMEEAKEEGIDFKFIQANDLKIELDEYDLIFIDTDHTYDQLSQELKLHGNKAKKYLIFHDTNVEEMTVAIFEFLEQNPCWKMENRYFNNHGLIVLKRNYDKPS